MPEPPALQQISVSLSVERGAIAPAALTSPDRRGKDLQSVRNAVLEEHGGPIAANLHERHPPFNICISERFVSHVREIHRLLDRALVDIVERWFSDKDADFPNRMPLEKHEEDLLRWIDGPGADLVPPFGQRYGMWRTDFLIERGTDGLENAKVCEINARIPFNGFWMVGLHENATKLLGNDSQAFVSPNDFDVRTEIDF